MQGSEAQDFLEEHSVPFYLRDAVTQLLESRSERPLEFLRVYFDRVDRGMHVHGREFGFVIATPRNRRAFVQLVHTSYPGLDDHAVAVDDVFQMLRLLCPDFPLGIVMDAMSSLQDDVHPTGGTVPSGIHAAPLVTATVPFPRLRDATLCWVLYNDFLHIARACMKDLQAESEATMAEAGEAIAQPPLAADAVTLRSEIIERFYSTTAGAGWGDAMHQPPQSVLEELLPAAGSSVTVGWEEFFHSVLRHPHTCGLLTPGP